MKSIKNFLIYIIHIISLIIVFSMITLLVLFVFDLNINVLLHKMWPFIPIFLISAPLSEHFLRLVRNKISWLNNFLKI
jgi:hypothetical protein